MSAESSLGAIGGPPACPRPSRNTFAYDFAWTSYHINVHVDQSSYNPFVTSLPLQNLSDSDGRLHAGSRLYTFHFITLHPCPARIVAAAH